MIKEREYKLNNISTFILSALMFLYGIAIMVVSVSGYPFLDEELSIIELIIFYLVAGIGVCTMFFAMLNELKYNGNQKYRTMGLLSLCVGFVPLLSNMYNGLENRELLLVAAFMFIAQGIINDNISEYRSMLTYVTYGLLVLCYILCGLIPAFLSIIVVLLMIAMILSSVALLLDFETRKFVISKFNLARIGITTFIALLLILGFFVTRYIYIPAALISIAYLALVTRYNAVKIYKARIIDKNKNKGPNVVTVEKEVIKVVKEKEIEIQKEIVEKETPVYLKPEVEDDILKEFKFISRFDKMEAFLLDTNGVYFKFVKDEDDLVLCDGAKIVALPEIIRDKDKDSVLEGINSKADSEIYAMVWSEQKSKYVNTIVKVVNLKSGNKYIILVDTETPTKVDTEEINKLSHEVERLNKVIKNKELDETRVFFSINEFLVSLIEKKSEESHRHINNISRCTYVILESMKKLYPELNIDDKLISDVCDASIFHDIGKVEVREELLSKPTKYTPEEFAEMKKHAVYGGDIVNRMPYSKSQEQVMKYAYDIATMHHERVDGKGYPKGLKGDEIPFYVQAVSLADVYEALVSRRSYKKAIVHDTAIDKIKNGECGAFSDKILACLDDCKDKLKRLSL